VTRRVGRRDAALQVIVLIALVFVAAAPAAAVAPAWQSKVDSSVLNAASLGQADFIVYMNAKADLSPADSLGNKVAKGTFVFNALRQTASTSQAPVLALLNQLGRPAQSFWIANTIVTSGNLSVLQSVAELADVKAIYPIGRGTQERAIHEPAQVEAVTAADALTNSVDYVHADEAWALGYRGQGAVVAGADSGVRWTHNALKGHYRGWNAATGTADHNYNWHDAIKWENTACPGSSPEPCDDDIILGGGHGSHTMGTMVGDDGHGNRTGMAPDAKWIACRNMNFGVGAVPLYMDCMQWFLAPTDISGNNPDPSKAPDVVNNSWGCVEGCAPPILKDLIEASRSAGIFYVVSAGNDNQYFLGLHMQCNTIAFPLATYRSGFTVGATGATNDGIADYSSLGPVSDNTVEGVNYTKPDITAPGSDIRSSLAGSDDEYGLLSGTSMAGPHVAGLVALIISANPSLRGHIDKIEDIIESTAKPLTSDLGCGNDTPTSVPNNVFGHGRIDALAAVQKAASLGNVDQPNPLVGHEDCIPDHVYFLAVVNDGNEPGTPREDFQADMGNFEFFRDTLRTTYCIPDAQAQILAFTDGWVDGNGTPQSPYPEASEANVKAELARLGAAASQHDDSIFFFFLSTHGIVYANAIGECPVERVAGSYSGLKAGGGESGDFYDCELGDGLNDNFAPTTRMFVSVDCSVCGGFSDSVTAASGTVPDGSVPVSAGVVGPNRIVVTGCAMTTECFGSDAAENGGVSYHHFRNVSSIEACDGWTAPAFPTVQGVDLPTRDRPTDGTCTASEWFFAAVNDAYVSQDELGIQQQFRIKYGFESLEDDILILGGQGPRPADLLPDCTTAPFSDVAIDHPFCPEISWLKSEGITNGFEDGTYRPLANVTRQAMAAFLARVAGATPADCTEAPFTDVAVNHPFCSEINWLKAQGITSGFGDGSFRPMSSVTRQAMAAFLSRVAGATPAACAEAPFTDVSVDQPFCKEINWLKTNGITAGFEDGTFHPLSDVTRQAMAAFLYRTSKLMN
jgi:serine protease AprX